MMRVFHILLLLSALLISTVISTRIRRHAGNICRTPLGNMGTCASLKHCPEVVNLFANLPKDNAKLYSRALQNACGNAVTNDNYPVVCCTNAVELSEMVVTTTTENNNMLTTTTTDATASIDISIFEDPTFKSTTCRTPLQDEGQCIPIRNCTKLLNRLRDNRNDDALKYYIRESNKICNYVGSNVCCVNDVVDKVSSRRTAAGNQNENDVPHRLPTEEEGCGISHHALDKIVGGQESVIGAWPWIVLIGYNARSLAPFKCGGTLITTRHVITAAHCMSSVPSFVRLGEYDISSDTETQHVDINIDKSVIHPNYKRGIRNDGRNDIAILRLEKNVDISSRISPICMPTSNDLRTKSYVNYMPFVAGWGRTMEGGSPSNILRQLQIPILNNSVCNRTYRANDRLISNDQFDESVLCAGLLTGGQDTCQGDSGGPLMIPEPYKGITKFYLIGVVSYGIGCARIGVPGVYTSTQYLMDWIITQVAEL